MSDLPATAWTVLGLLSFGRELSGYDMKKWADNSLRFFYWSPASSQIYGELRRLERLGYATSAVTAQDALRNKRVYAITDDGRAALREWLARPPEPTVLKHNAMLRVWLGHLRDPGELASAVEHHRAELVDELAAARHAADRASEDPDWVYPAAVTRWAVRRLESELALLDDLERDLSGGTRRRSRTATGR